MNTSSDRHEVQLFMESKFGALSADDFCSYRDQVASLSLGYQDVDSLTAALRADAKAYRRKAFASLVLGLNGLDNRAQTWAFIKLYYAFYFFQKAIIAERGMALFNCKGTFFSIVVSHGESPQRHNGRNFSNDHKAAATIFVREFKENNILLSQTIAGEETPHWMSHRRNWLNYQRRYFIDGVGDWALSDANMPFDEQVILYCADDLPIYCFLEESASLALPLKLSLQVLMPHRLEFDDYLSSAENLESKSVNALLWWLDN